MSMWHLLWIVPVAASVGCFVGLILAARGGDRA